MMSEGPTMVDQQDAWYAETEKAIDEIERQMTEIGNRISECSDAMRRAALEEQWRRPLGRITVLDASPVLETQNSGADARLPRLRGARC
jgi:hypothetical protein